MVSPGKSQFSWKYCVQTRRPPERHVEVSEAKEEAKGILGTEWAKAWRESQEQFYSTETQNLKWGGMRLWKVDSELEHCVREFALYPACSREPFKIRSTGYRVLDATTKGTTCLSSSPSHSKSRVPLSR